MSQIVPIGDEGWGEACGGVRRDRHGLGNCRVRVSISALRKQTRRKCHIICSNSRVMRVW